MEAPFLGVAARNLVCVPTGWTPVNIITLPTFRLYLSNKYKSKEVPVHSMTAYRGTEV